MDSVAMRWQNSLATVPGPFNTGCSILKKVALQGWKRLHVQDGQAVWMSLFLQELLNIFANLLVSLAIARISGMGSFLVTIFRKGLA